MLDDGGELHSNIFCEIVQKLSEEEIVKCSPRGKRMLPLLKHVQNIDARKTRSIASKLTLGVMACIKSGKRHKLPSSSQTAILSDFHQLRFNESIVGSWTVYISYFPEDVRGESTFALQSILDRMLKAMIEREVESLCSRKDNSSVLHNPRPLTVAEKNTERYVAGYVVVSLLGKARKRAKSDALRRKRHLFVRVLEKMQATHHPGEPDTPLEYTTYWMELVDRGGLFKVSDEVYKLMEGIEMVVREDMDTGKYVQDTDLNESIWRMILKSEYVLNIWEGMTEKEIPARYEEYTVELLHKIVLLYITARAHAFVKIWSMQLEQKGSSTKGTRKTLKREA